MKVLVVWEAVPGDFVYIVVEGEIAELAVRVCGQYHDETDIDNIDYDTDICRLAEELMKPKYDPWICSYEPMDLAGIDKIVRCGIVFTD